jgi:site-specific DNA recombinase
MSRRRDLPGEAALRCAIYTRKSTEEGLDQAFNSLDAQREACAAYVLSQKHEGWTLSPELYDDGGYSGGTMERPGLKQLLADVRAGRITTVIVYKVDRLTRSLADFAKIVEVLDAAGASFVSVTQAFNTTTSMGRLTLNVLLSFAQFEREVTGERIRDKIAASKARGMWMGGVVPLGYEVQDRKLIVDPAAAETVRSIFTRYLELGSVLALRAELEAQGVRSRVRLGRNGRSYGGTAFSRGALYLMLANQIYLGKICHKGTPYPGEHEAIIDAELFARVQRQLRQNSIEHTHAVQALEPSLLAGMLWDGEGRRMSPNHATKGTRRYRYYVSREDGAKRGETAWRVPAGDLEGVVLGKMRMLLRDAAAVDPAAPQPEANRIVAIAAVDLAGPPSVQRATLLRVVERITVHAGRIEIQLVSDTWGAAAATLETSIPARLVRRGKENRLAVPLNPDDEGRRDPALIKLVVKAHRARLALQAGDGLTLEQIATEQGYSRDYFAVLLRLSYLAPDITAAILEGRHPIAFSRQRLARAANLPMDWRQQREMLGFA